MRKAIVFKAFIAVAALLSPAAALAQQQINITKKDCRRVVSATPLANLAYKPGVGSRGRAVAPADLDGGGFKIELPEVFEFDITRDLNYFLGKPKADAEAAQAAANSAAKAQAAATSAETSAAAAESLSTQSDAYIAVEDAEAAVAAMQTERDALWTKYQEHPTSSRREAEYTAANTALTAAAWRSREERPRLRLPPEPEFRVDPARRPAGRGMSEPRPGRPLNLPHQLCRAREPCRSPGRAGRRPRGLVQLRRLRPAWPARAQHWAGPRIDWQSPSAHPWHFARAP